MAVGNLSPATGRKVGILIFSSDHGLISRIAEASGGEYNLRLASSPQMIEEALALHRSSIGVILVDLLSTQQQEVQSVINTLESVPSLPIVTVFVNESGDVSKLSQFLNISVPYYGLSSEFSAGEGREVIATAVKKHLATKKDIHEVDVELPRPSAPQKITAEKTEEQRETAVQPSSGQSPVLKIAMIAAPAAIILAVGIYFLINRDITPDGKDGAEELSRGEISRRQKGDDTSNSIQGQIDNLLAKTKTAVEAGELVEPENLCAFHYLSQALEMDPYNNDVKNAIKGFIGQIMLDVDASLAEHRLREASGTVEKVRRLQPDDPRFANFDNRLKEQINITIAESKKVAASGDLEQAKQMLGEVADVLSIDLNVLLSLHADISEQTKKQEQIENIISLFLDSMKKERLISPEKDNAKYYLLTLQALDADNGQLQPGFNQLGQKLLQRVDTYLDQEKLEQAQQWLREARTLGVFKDEVARRTTVLNDAVNKKRLAIAGQKREEYIGTLLRKIEMQIVAGAFIEPKNGNARHTLGLLMEAAVDDPRTKKAYSTFHKGLIDESRKALTGGQHERAESLLAYADAVEFRDQVAALKREIEVAREQVSATQKEPPEEAAEVAQEAGIKPIRIKKSVAPEYPSRAIRGNVEGWVHLAFTVNGSGETSDITVIDAEPEGVFEKAAIRAVSLMTYEIIDKNIKLQDFQYREEMRLRFQLEK